MNKKGAFDSVVIMFSIIGIMLLIIIFFTLFNFREYSSGTDKGVTSGNLDSSINVNDLFIVYLQTPVYTCSLKEAKKLNMTYGELLLYAQENDSTSYINVFPTTYDHFRKTDGGSKLLSSVWDYCTVKYFSSFFDSEIDIFNRISFVEFSGKSDHKYGTYTELLFSGNVLGTNVKIGMGRLDI